MSTQPRTPSTKKDSDLPPPRTQKGMRSVSAPLSNTRLNRLIYLLVLATALLAAYYSYRTVQYKSHVGGWWNLALGRNNHVPPEVNVKGERRAKGEHTVEDRINDLARALGMPSNELASAIAGAVRQYVPPASLSSVAAKETGPAVQALLKEKEGDADGAYEARSAAGVEKSGVLGGVASGVESFVGMDEP